MGDYDHHSRPWDYIDKIEGRFHPTPLGTTVNDISFVQNLRAF